MEYNDYYTFEARKSDYVVKTLVLRAYSEEEAYEKTYERTPEGCSLELVEIEPAI